MKASPKKPLDAEQLQFAADVAESIRQARRGEFAAVHTPEDMLERRKPGRPTGSVQAITKKPVQIRLDADVLEALRATGDGWQTRLNNTLRANLVMAGKLP